MTKRIIVLLKFLLLYYGLYAQSIVPKFETLGVNEGLSQSSVYSIFQDREGFMWFGTGDGLNRYDGTEIKTFHFADNAAGPASSNYAGMLCQDAAGNIWFNNNTGIFYYDKLKQIILRAYAFADRQFPSNYLGLVALENNLIYLENIYTGIVTYDIKAKTTTRYPYPYNASTHNAYMWPVNYRPLLYQHKIWVHGANTHTMYVFNTRTKKYSNFNLDKITGSVKPGGSHLYMVAHQKIILLDDQGRLADILTRPNTNKTLQYLAATEDPYGHLWITTLNNGILVYDIATRKYTCYRHNSAKAYSLPINMVTTTLIDTGNNLWIGTDGAGVTRLDIKPKRFYQFPLNDGDYPGMTDYFIKCIYDDSRGNVYFGTFSSGLCVLNRQTGQLTNYQNSPDNNSSIQANTVGAIFADREQNVWISCTQGVSIFKDGKFNRIPIKNIGFLNPFTSLVNHFYQLANGQIVAAARNGLICFTKNGNSFTGNYIKKNGFEITDVIGASDNKLWIGCAGDGLRLVSVNADTITTHQKYFAGSRIRSFHPDEVDPNLLWICTAKGLICFNLASKAYQIYTQANGMANSYVYGVLEDAAHNLWLSTNAGLSYFNRQNQTFKNYNVKDGLQSNEFNGGAFFKSAAGVLYFGGIKGFNWFYSAQPGIHKIAPQLGITAAAVDDNSVLLDTAFIQSKKIALAYNQKSVLLKFAVLDYTLPKANTIEYKMDGMPGNWFKTESKEIRYSNLSSGNYTLLVRAINSSDLKSAVSRIKIQVLPPFWKTLPFVLFVFALLVMAIVLTTNSISQKRLRLKLAVYERQKELEKERQRISREMHDDIGAGLTQITLISESINKSSYKKKKEITEIADTSRKLVSSMSEIIWSMNPANSTLDEFFAYLRESLYKILDYSDIKFNIILPDNFGNVALNTEQKRNLLLVVKEIVHNAVKHSRARQMDITAGLTGAGLNFTISDNGVGFDVNRHSHGNGLKNIQKRITDLEGALTITSQPGAGSTFAFFIPLKSHS